MKRWKLLSIGLLGAVGLSAQQSFSLEEAVSYALKNNKQLNATRYDIEKSESAYKEARAGWLPQVDATLDFQTYFGYEMEFNLGGSDFTPSATDVTNALSAANTTAAGMGGTFDAAQYAGGVAYESAIMAAMPPTVIDMGNSSTAQVQLGWMLFNGQILSGMRAAKIGMEMASTNVALSELDVRANVANTYYSVLTLEETLAIIDSSIVEMEDLVNKTEVTVRAGVLEETELDQLRIQLSNLKNTRLAMVRNVQITYNLLRFHLGMGVNDPIVLTDDVSDIMDAIIGEKALTQTFDVASNLTYQLVDKQVEVSEEMVDMEKMAYAPNVSAYYAYNAKLLTSGFDMTPNNVAGATLTIPIFSSGMRKNRVDQKKIELLQAEADREVLKDNLFLQESQLRFDYISKLEQYQNQKENVEVARRVFESYERKFISGTASGMDLTQANSSYLQAESDYLSAMLSLLQARVSFFKLLNTL